MKQGAEDSVGLGSGEVPAASPLVTLSGVVKWFDMLRGYGFFVPEDAEGDVLLHYSLLDGDGARALVPGARVTALVREGSRGRQAVSLVAVEPVETAVAERLPSLAPEGPLPDGFEPVQVRWFNRAKGYGFLLLADGFTQAFVHMETVRRAGHEILEPGQRLGARIENGPRGALAVELLAPQA
ncbi:MAG: cold-shock protein [Thermaurantiacus sp.]